MHPAIRMLELISLPRCKHSIRHTILASPGVAWHPAVARSARTLGLTGSAVWAPPHRTAKQPILNFAGSPSFPARVPPGLDLWFSWVQIVDFNSVIAPPIQSRRVLSHDAESTVGFTSKTARPLIFYFKWAAMTSCKECKGTGSANCTNCKGKAESFLSSVQDHPADNAGSWHDFVQRLHRAW